MIKANCGRRQKASVGISVYNGCMKIFFALLFAVLSLSFFMLVYRQYRNETGELQALFASGKAEPFPDGFYAGSSPSFSVGAWKGKRFDGEMKTGINVVGDDERFPFRMLVARGARDTEMDVIKIDYNLSENPWYLRFFAFDEMVRLEDGRYLGKIQLRMFGKPFTVGYFWQTK